jgi:hypothetical protein
MNKQHIDEFMNIREENKYRDESGSYSYEENVD